MRRRPLLLGCLSLLLAACAFPTAAAGQTQYPLPAQVTGVIDGDTLRARLGDTQTITVRLIGIDAPERAPGDCGAARATAYLRKLVQGRSVLLTSDPSQGAVDRFGRSLYYVDRDDGLDAGRAMLLAGMAELFVATELDFARYDSYADAENRASEARRGLWRACRGDFHYSRKEQLRDRRSAAAFVRRYYSAISNRRFTRAWRQLSPRVRRSRGSFGQWKAGYRRMLSTRVSSTRVRLRNRRAVISVAFSSRDRDACNGNVVRQSFRGTWVLQPRRGSWVAVKVRARKTGGGRVRLSKSRCPPPPKPRTPAPPTAAPPTTNCQGYDPCIAPGPDVDCAGGSGNGPRYVSGPVSVTGSDPYGLDSDGDGVACES